MFDNLFETLLLIAGLSIFPALTLWIILSGLKKEYNKGFEDGYHFAIGENIQHGRPKGFASQSKYNSGFIDGQIKAKEVKIDRVDDSVKDQKIGADLLKHLEEFT